MNKETESAIRQYMADGLDIGKWTHGGAIDCTEITRDVLYTFSLNADHYYDLVFDIAEDVAAEYEVWTESNIGGV